MSLVDTKRMAPPYGHRKGWLPRTQQEFGDGGAYPEVQVVQHPLDMGHSKQSSNSLPTTLDANGKVRYDVIVKHGHGKGKVVHSKMIDLMPKQFGEEELRKPDEESIQETTEKTRTALEKLVASKISAAMPVKAAKKQAPNQYIRYTPAQQSAAYNSGANQRVIKMVEVQKDPMEPPRFNTTKKIPRGPPSPPAPVMHSPNRKVTVKEQQEWKIPPCISNWKNAKGFTIPLDKRLAADGRGLQGVHINENFAKLSEALYIAERKARDSVEMRAQMEKRLAQKAKEEHDGKLQKLAKQAREERAGIRRIDDDKVEERDKLRQDRRQDRQRQRNIANAAPDKRNRLQKERDVSEAIALGLPSNANSNEVQFDQRLYNQSKGMDSGFNEDDSYNVYDKPWRNQGDMAQSIYKPSRDTDQDVYGGDLDKLIAGSKRFVPDKGFAGTNKNASRTGPVQYEEDPFGLDSLSFLKEAKNAPRKRTTDTGHSKDVKKSRRD